MMQWEMTDLNSRLVRTERHAATSISDQSSALGSRRQVQLRRSRGAKRHPFS